MTLPMLDNRETGDVISQPFAAPDLEAVISMTPSQLEIWATCMESDTASCAYNNTIRISIEGSLDLTALSTAVDALIARHQSLRASFHGESFTMCIAEKLPIEVKEADFSSVGESQIEKQLQKIARDESSTPFNLFDGPVVRVIAVKTGEEAFEIFMTTHQICVDHWSVDLLADELAELYSASIEQRNSKLPPAYSCTDYSHWLNGSETVGRHRENLQFWHEKFIDALPTTPINFTSQVTTRRGYAATRVDRDVSVEVAKALVSAAATEKSTFFAYTLAVYVAFLARANDTGEVRVAIPAAGQLDVGENRIASACINTLPLSFAVNENMTFKECLQVVRKELYSAQSYTPFTYTEILNDLWNQQVSGRLPLATTMFNVDQEKHNLAFCGLSAHYVIVPRIAEKFEMSMTIVHYGDNTQVQCYFNDDLFNELVRLQIIDAYLAFLNHCITFPEVVISELAFDIGARPSSEASRDYSAERSLIDQFPKSSFSDSGSVGTFSTQSALEQIAAVTSEFDLPVTTASSAHALPKSAAPVEKAQLDIPSQESFYFGENQELYGIYRPLPPGADHIKKAVLLCGGHGNELARCHRLIRRLSVALQKAGIPSLKFDYYGTGDSLGRDEDANLHVWHNNILTAREELIRRSQCDRIAAIGIRIGGSLLLNSMCQDKFDQIILIDVITDGGKELMEWRQKHRGMLRDNYKFRFGRRRNTWPDFEELAGFCYSHQMINDISQINISREAISGGCAISAIDLSDSGWAKTLEISCDNLKVNPGWNDPVSMHDPVVSSELISVVCNKLSGLKDD